MTEAAASRARLQPRVFEAVSETTGLLIGGPPRPALSDSNFKTRRPVDSCIDGAEWNCGDVHKHPDLALKPGPNCEMGHEDVLMGGWSL